MGRAGETGWSRTRIKSTFIGFITEVASSCEVRHAKAGHTVNSLRNFAIAKDWFTYVCDVIDNDVATSVLKFDYPVREITGANQTGPEC